MIERSIERMSADIVIFLDADIRNLTTDWMNQLVGAIVNDNCDMSRGFYTRHARDAAVTKTYCKTDVTSVFSIIVTFRTAIKW
jgi:hypothetical protein